MWQISNGILVWDRASGTLPASTGYYTVDAPATDIADAIEAGAGAESAR